MTALRRTLVSEERDGRIFQALLCSPYWNRESFFVYRSVRSEVKTDEIISALRLAGKRVCVPRVSGGVMSAVEEKGEREFFYGIPQPASGSDEPCAVVLTPLLAFDEAGFRLGYGGGYYDKYFAKHGGLRVGLAYGGQAAGSLPRNEFDVPLHAVITETGVRQFT